VRIAIFGAGGVGGYFGGRLAEAGREVVFIARGEHLQAMRGAGLRVDSISGDFRVHPVRATDDPAEAGTADAILVAVKAWQVPEAARAMRPMVGPETFVVPLQNGVEAPDELAAVLGRERVLGGVCGLISFVAGPGHIRHTGIEPFVQFGELDNHASTRAKRLLDAFAPARGVKAEIPPDIHVSMWRKFLFIAAMSGMGAVTRVPVGAFRSVPETRALLERAVEEIHRVARARGVELPDDAVAQTLELFDRLPPASTASMQRDIMEGRPSELEAQNGAVLRLGRAAGVDTPLHAFIYASLLPGERRARGEAENPA